MNLLTRFWLGLTRLLDISILSPMAGDGIEQMLLIDNTPPTFHMPSLDIKDRPAEPKFLRGPIFTPPGALPDPDGSLFTCDYSKMAGWRPCSKADDRTCWLTNDDMGQFDIYTDYEALRPQGIVRNYTLHVKDGWLAADGQNFTNAKLFNNSYPGPWLQACWGDVLNITVVNNLTWNGTSVHWHGIRQLNTMHMDGVPGITQCPIAPNDTFTYTWNATQYGSSWYHSHYSVQYADGLAGPLTIHGPSSYPYDEPASTPLLMTDWSHLSMFQNDGLLNETILLNGTGNVTRFSGCTNPSITDPKITTCFNNTAIPEPFTLKFDKPLGSKRPKRYLLRIINTSYETQFVFSIDNHNLTVIGADFVPVHNYSTHALLVGIGQRYHVVVEANPTGPDAKGRTDFWIRTGIADCFGKDHTKYPLDYDATGILRYRHSSKALPSSLPWPDISHKCKDEDANKLSPIVPWIVGPAANNQSFGEERDVNGFERTRGTFPKANFSLELPDATDFTPLRINYSDPIFLHLNQNSTIKPWASSWKVIPENFSNTDWVYLVVQGDRSGHYKRRGSHPIHLHGHDFAILAQVSNASWYNAGQIPLNLCNPARRDVVLLPDNGYVVIAFKADNPGNWLMHCHIADHAFMGLAAQILERQSKADEIWPHPSDGNLDLCSKHKKSDALCRAQTLCRNWEAFASPSNCKKWWAPPNKSACHDLKSWWFQDDSGI